MSRAIPPELIGKQWTRDDAIAVMCRSLARFLDEFGFEGDAEAVRFAEHVLRQPALYVMSDTLTELQTENEALRAELTQLRAAARETQAVEGAT